MPLSKSESNVDLVRVGGSGGVLDAQSHTHSSR